VLIDRYKINLCTFFVGLTKVKAVLFVFDGLIDYLRFYVSLKNFSPIWRRHHRRWRAAKFRPLLGAQGLWAGRDLYRATPAVTQHLSFSGLIWRTAPFSRLLRHTRGCGGSVLTRILTDRMPKMVFIFNCISISKCSIGICADYRQMIFVPLQVYLLYFITQRNNINVGFF
jgi:hypothetical protein